MSSVSYSQAVLSGKNTKTKSMSSLSTTAVSDGQRGITFLNRQMKSLDIKDSINLHENPVNQNLHGNAVNPKSTSNLHETAVNAKLSSNSQENAVNPIFGNNLHKNAVNSNLTPIPSL